MLTDKIEMLLHESCQREVEAIVLQFRQAVLKHFEVVEANSRRLINERWRDNG